MIRTKNKEKKGKKKGTKIKIKNLERSKSKRLIFIKTISIFKPKLSILKIQTKKI